MWTRSIIIFSCSLALFAESTSGICNVSRYTGAFGSWVKCSNATVGEAMSTGGRVVAAITILQSRIHEIPANAFSNHGKSLQALSLQNCGIRQLDDRALADLTYLKKLNMPNNNMSEVRSSWFVSLISLEQLDLSFNNIRSVDPAAFGRLTNLRRLNLDDNQLTCLNPKDMEPMRSIAKMFATRNPLSLTCRGRMTLWFNDKGINYLDSSNGLDTKFGSWLDRVLWLCAQDDYVETKTETRMRECVLLNLFNQLRSSLKKPNIHGNPAKECSAPRRAFVDCIAKNGRNSDSVANGEAATTMILALRGAQEKLHPAGH